MPCKSGHHTISTLYLKYLSFKADEVFSERGVYYISLLYSHGMTSLGLRHECRGARFIWKLVDIVIDCPSLVSSLYFRVPHFT